MGTYKAFKTDSTKETQGVVVDLGEAGKFTIARAGGSNSAYERAIMLAMKPFTRAIRSGLLSEVEARNLSIPPFVSHVLKGWENVTGEDDKPIPYTRENAIKVLTELPDLYYEIKAAADNQSLFRAENLSAAEKN